MPCAYHCYVLYRNSLKCLAMDLQIQLPESERVGEGVPHWPGIEGKPSKYGAGGGGGRVGTNGEPELRVLGAIGPGEPPA